MCRKLKNVRFLVFEVVTEHAAGDHHQPLPLLADVHVRQVGFGVEIVIDPKGGERIDDWTQTTCGQLVNKCLVNALDQKWIDGIYGHAYTVPDGVKKSSTVRERSSATTPCSAREDAL